MKKLMILPPIHAAVLLLLASCGGGDDNPTAPGGGRLDSRLFGSWFNEGAELLITFREDGTGQEGGGREGAVRPRHFGWRVEGGQLMFADEDLYTYAIRDGKLTFAKADAREEIGYFSYYEFRADGNPDGLTGVTWVDEEGSELVFRSDGIFIENNLHGGGTWTAAGSTVTIRWPEEGSDYEVDGNTLTISIQGADGAWERAYKKQ